MSNPVESKWSEVTFVKGQSGNPGGLPKGMAELKALARQHAPAAIDTLASIMRDSLTPPAARVSAATALLDRGFGKPVQAVTGADGESPLQIMVVTGIERSE